MTSKDWPEVHLFSSITSISEMTHQFRSTVSAVEGRVEAAHILRCSWGPNKHANMHTDTGKLGGSQGTPMTRHLADPKYWTLRSVTLTE